MKKIITTAALFTFGLSIAQEKSETEEYGFVKGNLFLGGELTVSNLKETKVDEGVENNETKINSFFVNPKVGYFFTDRLAAGIGLTYLSNKITMTELINDETQSKTDKGNGFGAQIFARYYFLKLGKRFHTYAELNAGFGSMKNESTRQEVTQKGTIKNTDAAFDIGMNYFLTPKLAVSFTMANVLKYNILNIEIDGVDSSAKSSGFSANLNVFKNIFEAPTFGLLYRF